MKSNIRDSRVRVSHISPGETRHTSSEEIKIEGDVISSPEEEHSTYISRSQS